MIDMQEIIAKEHRERYGLKEYAGTEEYPTPSAKQKDRVKSMIDKLMKEIEESDEG